MTNDRKIIEDIRFWIFLFFVLRLFTITDPPLEVAHNWRQTTVAMAARNFFETDANVFFPRIDIEGEKSGIAGMEFPLLNYLIYLMSLIFGYAHWYGRLINLVVSSLGVFYFYKVVRKYFDQRLAFSAAFVLLISVWLNYSRKIMPDTFSTSLVIIGLYYGTNYLDRGYKLKDIFLFLLTTLSGILSKLPSGYMLVIFIPLVLNRKTDFKPKLTFILLGAVICTMTAIYYFYWVPHLVATYGCNHFFMGKNFEEGIKDTVEHIPLVAQKFYEEALGYTGFLMVLAGSVIAAKNKDSMLLKVCLLLSIAFLVVVFKAGSVFYHHAYYIVPFAPVMSLLAGYGICQLANKNLVWVSLVIIATENIATRFSDYHINPNNAQVYFLERDLDRFSGRRDLVLINSGNVPTPMYFAHRKGWVATNALIANADYVQQLKKKGLKFIVILKEAFGSDLKLNYTEVFESAAYRIYKI